MAFELNIGENVVFHCADKGENSRADTLGRGNTISQGEGSEELHALGNNKEPQVVSEQKNDGQI